MTTAQPKPTGEMRMSGKEFDRIMGQALQVRPQEASKPKKAGKAKAKTTRPKARTRK